jgi:O-antigen/teichoic acid export membrane protein
MLWSTLGLSPKRARHARKRVSTGPLKAISLNGRAFSPTNGTNGAPPSAEHGLLARSSGLSLLGMAASVVLGFGFVLVVTHLEHVQGAGTLFEAIAAFTILENVTELGADTGLLRILPRYRVARATQDLKNLLVVSLVPPVLAAAVAGGLLWGLAPQFARLFIHDGSVAQGVTMIRTVAPFLPFATLMTVAVAASRGLEAFGPYVGIQSLAVPSLRLALLPCFAAVGLSGPRGFALAWGTPLAIGCVAALVVLVRRGRREFLAARPLHPSLHIVQVGAEFWRFTAPRGLAAVFQIMVIWVDILLVGAIESPRQAAIYTVASRYVLMGTLALQALGIALGPQISRLLASGRRDEARSVFRLATWWVIVASWPLFFVMACFSPLLMRLFGHNYVSGSVSLTILALGMLALTGTGSNGIVLLMAGKSSWSLAMNAAALAINLTLNLLLIPHIGIDGAAVAWAVTIAFNNGGTAILVWRAARLDSLGLGASVAVAISAMVGAVALAARLTLGAGVLSFCVAISAGALVAGIGIWRSRSVLRLDAFRSLLATRGGRW